MRALKSGFFLGLTVLWLVAGSGCTTVSYAPHGAGPIPVYLGNAPVRGKAYRSLGVIKVTRGSVGWSFLGSDLDIVEVGDEAMYVESDDAGDDVVEFLNSNLQAEARQLGASAIINVRYGSYEIPLLLPLIGPLGYKRFYAAGEAVQF